VLQATRLFLWASLYMNDRKFKFFIPLTLVCLMSNSLADEKLDMLKNISAAGAPVLTLKMLDQAQPTVDADLYEWILWEQERYIILSRWQEWNELLIRLENLPNDLPEQFRYQAVTYKIRAYLEIGQTDTARQLLREQLWLTTAGAAVEYQTWRRLVISSYLKDGRLEDARIAMLRFNQDFDAGDESWVLLRATVLIRSGRYDQAIQVLDGVDGWQARLTSYLAQYRSQLFDPKALWEALKKQLARTEFEVGEQATLWVLAYYAGQQMSPVDRVVALEQVFKSDSESPLELFQLHPDQLWAAYLEYAQLVGNRAELLIGDDAQWLDLAKKTSTATPVKSRSLFALLMLRGTDQKVISEAAESYMQTFAKVDASEKRLLEQLFNHSETFSDAGRIPPVIRYLLVDLALKNADIDEATRQMSGLDEYPEGSDRFKWQLRQARVLILGGRYDEGNEVLATLISEYSEPTAESTDLILQILFDLQTVNLLEQAIIHFNRLLQLSIEPKQHREILFWIADSFKALKKYDQAALLYLQSAMLPGPEVLDLWAQTARFNAAESLQKSGMVDDARRIYEELLRVTKDPARRSFLNHNIQQLWLNQNTE
jgi:tetratricopeptide (TPR) repeat protein